MKTQAAGANGRVLERILRRLALPLLLVVAALSITGCELIGDIFKAGIWVGFVVVAGLVVLIGGLIALVKR